MFPIRWLWRNMGKRYRIVYIVALFLSAVTSLMILINPFLTSRLVDEVIVAQNPDPLMPLLAAMLAVQAVRLLLRYGMVMGFETASQSVVIRLRQHLFRNLQHQESRFFDRNRTGDLMTRLSADLDWCRHFLSYLVYQAIDCVVLFGSTLAFLLVINWQLTLALVAVTPVLMLVTRTYSKRVRPLFVGMRERLSEMNTAAQENIAGNRVVKAFSREDYEQERFRQRNERFRDANLEINKKWLTFYPVIEMLANVMTPIIILLGGLFIIHGTLTPGELTLFTSLSWALSNPMRNLGALLNDYQRFFASAQKIIEVYYARPLIVDRPDAEEHPDPRGHIVFDDVCFSHGKTTVLDHVSFEVQPGQTLAIMGPTGAGKTTIVNLLARFYDVSGGAVYLDGGDVRLWKLSELRGALGTATQDVFLFSDTVEGNIAFGAPNLSEKETQDMACRAAADEFVAAMPEGYDTIVGERGVGLSGGQRQRLALARALAVKPAVLILDDTTSALDMETERYIQQQLRDLPYPCTKILIAQRVSSVKEADQILILEHGCITERGTHEELLRNKGYYWQTYALQNDLPLDNPDAAKQPVLTAKGGAR